jgi:hypothetical protein
MSGPTLIERLEAGAVEPCGFGHRQHLQAAYELLERAPFLDAAVRYSRGIERLAAAAGAADKFNLTVTIAFLSLIAERMAQRRYESFAAFLAEHADLEGNALAPYYSRIRLGSLLARRTFLMPDRQAEQP